MSPGAPVVDSVPSDREAGNVPCWHVQIQSARLQIVAISYVSDFHHMVLEPPLTASEVRKWETDIALTLVGSIVHRHQPSRTLKPLPGESQETVPCPITLPSGNTLQHLPLAG